MKIRIKRKLNEGKEEQSKIASGLHRAKLSEKTKEILQKYGGIDQILEKFPYEDYPGPEEIRKIAAEIGEGSPEIYAERGYFYHLKMTTEEEYNDKASGLRMQIRKDQAELQKAYQDNDYDPQAYYAYSYAMDYESGIEEMEKELELLSRRMNNADYLYKAIKDVDPNYRRDDLEGENLAFASLMELNKKLNGNK